MLGLLPSIHVFACDGTDVDPRHKAEDDGLDAERVVSAIQSQPITR